MYDDPTTPIERAVATGDREFRELADFAPVMIWRSGRDRQCDWFNRPWLEFTGREMAQEVGSGWADGVHPHDLEQCLATYAEAFAARKPFSMEYRLRRHDGEFRWVLDRGAPYTRHGSFVGYWGSCTDVTAHREAQRLQHVLIDELHHRVKNTLAVVQAMATQSFRDGRPLDESMCAFESRLCALADAHDLLVAQSWEEVALQRVVESTVAPHDPGHSRITIGGPAVMLRSDTAMTVAMAMHELLTNACKYGALSTPEGTITIAWSFGSAGDDDRIRILWKERGGPTVTPPARRGFGTRFIERALAGQGGGDAVVHFEPDGVRCVFHVRPAVNA